jgi:hypothetical protein
MYDGEIIPGRSSWLYDVRVVLLTSYLLLGGIYAK